MGPHLAVLFAMDPSVVVKKALYYSGRAVREAGQSLDRLGCSLQGRLGFKEQRACFSFFRNDYSLDSDSRRIAEWLGHVIRELNTRETLTWDVISLLKQYSFSSSQIDALVR